METSLNLQESHKATTQGTMNMVCYLTGQLVSLFGSSIYGFAVSLFILKSTGSGMSFALSLVLTTLPRVIFGPIAGTLADRVDRKRLAIYLDIMSAVFLLGLWQLMGLDAPRIGYLYAANLILAILSTFYSITLSAAMPKLVVGKQLMQLNALSQAISSLSGIAGPVLGGMCFAFMDIGLFFFLNGLSFAVAAVSTACLRFFGGSAPALQQNLQTQKGIGGALTTVLADIRSGASYMGSQPWLLMIGGFAILFNFIIMLGMTVPMPYIVTKVLNFTPRAYGLLNMMFPVGILITSLALSLAKEPKNIKALLLSCMGGFATLMVVMGAVASQHLLAPNNTLYLLIFMGCYLAVAAFSMLINIPVGVALQKMVPDEMRGRVQGALMTLAQAFAPLGAILSGLLLGLVPAWILPVCCGVVMLIIIGIAALVSSEV